MVYEVHLDVYDGPFNLLLQMISSEEVDLYTVSLSTIVDAFLRELRHLEACDLERATEFLLIASTLVELKCRRLLPGSDESDPEEELSLFEARDYLLARLVESKTFTAAADRLFELESLASRSYARRNGPDERFEGVVPDLLAHVTADQLCRLARGALAGRPPAVVATGHIHGDEISVAETLEALTAVLPMRSNVTLLELLDGDCSATRFVVTFLALLELFKRESVDLLQKESFAELLVIWTGETNVDSAHLGGLDRSTSSSLWG